MNSLSFQKFQIENLGFFIFTVILSFIVMIALMCYKEVAKKVPTNYSKPKIILSSDDNFHSLRKLHGTPNNSRFPSCVPFPSRNWC